MSTPAQTPTSKTIYVTRSGLPLRFELEWPFRYATSGADFDVLHTAITLVMNAQFNVLNNNYTRIVQFGLRVSF